MTTVVTDVVVRRTERQEREVLFEFRGVYAKLGKQASGKVELAQGETTTLVASKLLCAYFPKPTIIQLKINTITVTQTVNGTLLLPFACEVTITNNSSTATDPTVVQYIVA